MLDFTNCVSVRGRTPHYCTDPDVTWGVVGDAPSCTLLGGFAIGARVALLWQHNANANVSEYMLVLALCLVFFINSVYNGPKQQMRQSRARRCYYVYRRLNRHENHRLIGQCETLSTRQTA